MQSANNMKFSDRLGVSGSSSLESLFQSHCVSARSIFLASKSAQAAGSYANIGRVQMAVDVEIRFVPMHPFADIICHPAHGQNVARPVERKRVSLVQPGTGKNLVMNRPEPGIVSLK